MVYIICGMGGSGKTTLAEALVQRYPERFQAEVGYTTRPQRPGEIDGKTYHFEKEVDAYDPEIFGYRGYETVEGTWYYWHKKVTDSSKDIIAVSTFGTLNDYADIYGKKNICCIVLDVDPLIAFKRMYAREQQKTNPDYKEVCRRYISDCETLVDSIEDIKYYGIDANGNIEETIQDALGIIGR